MPDTIAAIDEQAAIAAARESARETARKSASESGGDAARELAVDVGDEAVFGLTSDSAKVTLASSRVRSSGAMQSGNIIKTSWLQAVATVGLMFMAISMAVLLSVWAAPFLQEAATGEAASVGGRLLGELPLIGGTAALTALLLLPVAMYSARRRAVAALEPFLKLRRDLDVAATAAYPQLGRYATSAANDVAAAINSLSADLRERDIELESRRRRFDQEVEARMAEIKEAYAQIQISLVEAERVRREAERANHAKSDFLAKMSHEIRTPLNGILGAMDLMLATGLNARQSNYASTIRASSKTLLDLLNGILNLAKIEAGEVEIAVAEYDPTEMLDNIAVAFAPTASGNGLRISSAPAPDMPYRVIGDPARVRQIVVNLVGNAVKFTSSGGVVINAEWRADEDGDVDAGHLEIDIVDTGPGVPEQSRDRIFDRFEQGDGSMSRRHGGAGLGLAIARDLARRMGGDVTLSKSNRSGSIFRLTVPARVNEAEGPSDFEGLMVLAAEADPIDQQALVARLVRHGVEIAEANGPAAAADALQAALDRGDRLPDIILAAAEDSGALQALRTSLLVIDEDQRPKLGVFTDFGSPPLPPEFDDITDWALLRPMTEVDLVGVMQSAQGTADIAGMQEESFGLSILLAEDNPVNVLVTRELLIGLGCKVKVAENGLIATEMAEVETYDLILMDCQMPIMDGYEATRQIRGHEADSKRTPIIAVTANAFAEDRDACFAAGMDGFLAKPVTHATLIEALRPYAEPDAAEMDEAAETPEKSIEIPIKALVKEAREIADDGFPEALDYDVIQALRKVGRDGDKMVTRVINLFLKSSPTLAENLAVAAKVGDLTAAGRHAHALKSASGNVGSRTLPTMLADVESMAKAGNADGVQTLADEVNTAYEDLVMALKTLNARG